MGLTRDIINVIDDVLKLGSRSEEMDGDTRLLGNIAEFDSMAVVSVLTALEEIYDITVEDDEIDADVFETVGTLVAFVERKLDE